MGLASKLLAQAGGADALPPGYAGSSAPPAPTSYPSPHGQPAPQLGAPGAPQGAPYGVQLQRASAGGAPVPLPYPGTPGGALPYREPIAPHPAAAATAYPDPAGQQRSWRYQQQQTAPPMYQNQEGMTSAIAAKLQKIVAANQLQRFYPPERLQDMVARVAQRVGFNGLADLADRWRISKEMAVDLSALALYDTVIYADDSSSMKHGKGERIEDLKNIMGKVAEVATLFDENGISVRFINSNKQGNRIRNADDAHRLLADLEYRGDTKLATFMEKKILQCMPDDTPLNKPLLIITIFDGEPTEKPKNKIIETIINGPGAVAYQFVQVGDDQGAQVFLDKLDKLKNHPQLGKRIDCTSRYELESADYARKGITLSKEAWLVKVIAGPIDPEYDELDEASGLQLQQPYGGAAGYQYPSVSACHPLAGSAHHPQQQYITGAYTPQGQQAYRADAQSGAKKKGSFDEQISRKMHKTNTQNSTSPFSSCSGGGLVGSPRKW